MSLIDQKINNYIAKRWCVTDLTKVTGAVLTLSKADIKASSRIKGDQYDSYFGMCDLVANKKGAPELTWLTIGEPETL